MLTFAYKLEDEVKMEFHRNRTNLLGPHPWMTHNIAVPSLVFEIRCSALLLHRMGHVP